LAETEEHGAAAPDLAVVAALDGHQNGGIEDLHLAAQQWFAMSVCGSIPISSIQSATAPQNSVMP
jgi:hypothetical protein